MPTVRDDLRTIILWIRGPHSRGVTVYTGIDAEFYRTADHWVRDEKGILDVKNRLGRVVATFLPNTWVRVEAGPPARITPTIPPTRAE